MQTRHVTLTIIAALACAVTAATSITAQAPTIDLGKRNARSLYSFGRLSDAKELPDGRIIASDGKERAYQMLDLGKGTMTVFGETGDDPTMYQSADVILPAGGDSLLLFAAQQRTGTKFLKVAPSGTIVEAINTIRDTARTRVMGQPVGADNQNRIYFLSPMTLMSKTVAQNPQTGAIDTVTHLTILSTTTIARLTPGQAGTVDVDTIASRHADQMTVPGVTPPNTTFPYPFRDAWAIRPDGLGAHVIADKYEVIWSRDGKITGRTGLLPSQPIALTAGEQQAFKDSVIEARRPKPQTGTAGTGMPGQAVRGVGGVAAMGGGGGRASGAGMGGPPSGAPNGPLAAPPPLNIGTFPENKPAILAIPLAALFDAKGNLWIAKERAHGDAVPHYDVVAEGKGIIAQVNLPAGTRLVSVGRQGVYLARIEDNEEWLERYPLPKF
jgi:hypothetical protein